ncbi:MAG: AMP-binding protein [Veillonella sp.]|uniref:AMP-binding protein n=1 Tax=Veillonella sp. TaxID=1926307 RepID=UPI0025EEB005|nr:AMP-binding protein [Veillonella sp.]MBS4913699.1 AMP-binding protein [Veillonella sp.]
MADRLFHALADYGKTQPQKTALVIEDKKITYGQLWECVTAPMDAGCDTDGVSMKGTVCFIKTENIETQLISWLNAIYNQSRPLLCHADLSEVRTAQLCKKYALDDVAEQEHIIPEKASFGVLTSGTTGLPKVLWRNLSTWSDFFDEQNRVFLTDKESVLFVHGSMSFTGNLNSVLSTLYAGGTAIIARYMSPRRWVELLRLHQVTHIYLLPTKLRMLLPVLHETLPDLQVIFTGSQLLDYKLVLGLKKLQPHTTCILYYGASELNYITYCTFEEWLREPDTVGYAFKGVAVSLDRDNRIVVDTPYGIEGISRPFTVGDLGAFTESGRLLFRGRNDAIINRGGYKLSLPYLESQLLCVPGIADVVVLGVKDDLRGEQPVAFIVPDEKIRIKETNEENSSNFFVEDEHIVDESDINSLKCEIYAEAKEAVIRAVHERLQAKECPKHFFWLRKLPLTGASKVNRAVLTAFYLSQVKK